MKLSYEGIGQWAATFACAGVAEGDVVKVSGGGAVGVCGDGEDFCGVALGVSRTGDACAVALGGLVRADFSGAAPALGWTALRGDGSGGVKADAAGRSYRVVEADAAAKTVTFAL